MTVYNDRIAKEANSSESDKSDYKLLLHVILLFFSFHDYSVIMPIIIMD